MPRVIAALRPGGAFIPFFTTRAELKWPFFEFFDRVTVVKRLFAAYATTEYTRDRACIYRCFVGEADPLPCPKIRTTGVGKHRKMSNGH
jgi:hypothetical protein